jgi:2-keto-4-pentenoate hydratase
MTPEAVEKAARILLAARRERRRIPCLPADCRPADVEEAYQLQARLLALIDTPTVGWIMACTGTAMQKVHGLSGPYWGRALADAVYESPARIDMSLFTGPPSLEIELVFRLGADLPPRAAPYDAEEVADAVACMHAGLELVDGRWADLRAIDGPSLVADNGSDGLLILGPAHDDWRALDRAHLSLALTVNGAPAGGGSGGNAMGDPLNALTWLANAQSRRGVGLRAGETVNTGNCLEAYHFAAAAEEIVADCGPLGAARAILTGKDMT